MTAAYLPADDPQVVGAYRFDGTDLIDAAGGEEFTATGTAVAQPSNTSGVYASDGSGGNDFAGDGTAVLYKTQKAVTVEGVVKLPTGYTDGAFICRLGGPIASGAAADNASWTFLIRPSASGGELRFASESGSGTEATVDSDAAAPLDEWIHVAFTRNAAGAIINLYINGVNVGSGTVTPTSGGGFAQGTADIGTGANGTVTVTPAVTAAEGVESNAIDVIVHADTNPPLGRNRPLSAVWDGTNLHVYLAVTNGALVAAANTATLVAAAIDALPEFGASASGTGADALTASETVSVTGGTSGGTLGIGGDGAGTATANFEGLIRDVRITRRALSAAEVAAASATALGR